MGPSCEGLHLQPALLTETDERPIVAWASTISNKRPLIRRPAGSYETAASAGAGIFRRARRPWSTASPSQRRFRAASRQDEAPAAASLRRVPRASTIRAPPPVNERGQDCLRYRVACGTGRTSRVLPQCIFHARQLRLLSQVRRTLHAQFAQDRDWRHSGKAVP